MRVEIVEVPGPRVVVPVDQALTKQVLPPQGLSTDNEITYGDVVSYLVQSLGAVEQCNGQLKAIRELPLE